MTANGNAIATRYDSRRINKQKQRCIIVANKLLQAAFDRIKKHLTKDGVPYGGWLIEGGKEVVATREFKCKLVDNVTQFVLDGRRHGDDDKLWRQYQLLLAQ